MGNSWVPIYPHGYGYGDDLLPVGRYGAGYGYWFALLGTGLGRHNPWTLYPLTSLVRFAKPHCPILEFEFLSRFFVNLLLEVLYVITIAYFYL
jgi:hypothetical protein